MSCNNFSFKIRTIYTTQFFFESVTYFMISICIYFFVSYSNFILDSFLLLLRHNLNITFFVCTCDNILNWNVMNSFFIMILITPADHSVFKLFLCCCLVTYDTRNILLRFLIMCLKKFTYIEKSTKTPDYLNKFL